MILVLDTSAAIEMALYRSKAGSIGGFLQNAEWVIAPDIFIAESANSLWKYHQFKGMPEDKCIELLEKTINMVDDFFSPRDLFREAFNLACMHKHPVYDLLFLVLSRRYNAHLCTVDAKLRKLALKNSIHTCSVT